MNRAGASALLGRAAARILWQPDMWDRLVLAAKCVDTASTVMDVGGRGRQLARFLPSAKVSTANIVPPADFIVDARVLPFTNGQFDVVTSCDTLEHMPAEQRPDHVAELVRVARRRLVICCPYGSPEKQKAEWDVADVVHERGRHDPALSPGASRVRLSSRRGRRRDGTRRCYQPLRSGACTTATTRAAMRSCSTAYALAGGMTQRRCFASCGGLPSAAPPAA